MFLVSCQEKIQERNYKDFFTDRNEAIEIIENDSILLGGIGIVSEYQNNLYFPSYSSNKIYAYNKDNQKIRIINKNDQLSLRMPSQIVFIDNRYYVNDRGNHHLRILDSNFNLLSSTGIMGQVDDIRILKKNDNTESILVHGVQQKGKEKKTVLFRITDVHLKQAKFFGEIPKSTKYYSWKISTDSSNNIYIVNVIGSKVDVYTEGGKMLKTIQLKSSNIDNLLQENEIKDLNPMEISEYVKDKNYLIIQNINIIEDNIVIQYRLSGVNNQESKYLIDIFNLNGRLLASLDSINEQIISVKKNMVKTLKDNSSSKKPSLIIKEYIFNIKNEK